MKLFVNKDLDEGSCLPESWVAFGRRFVEPSHFSDGRVRDWKYLQITLPLLHNAAYKSMICFGVRIGWWCPQFLFRWRTCFLGIQCRYKWMGKGLDRDFIPMEEFDDAGIPCAFDWEPYSDILELKWK